MTVLKYDDVIKKVTRSWLLIWYLLKDLMQYHIHAKFQNQGLIGSGFMTGGFLDHMQFNVKETQAGWG